MKLTTILLLAGFLHAGAKGFTQTVTLTASRMPLAKVCTEIEKQTGYYFVYARNMNEKKLLVSVQLKNTGLKDALQQVFKGLPFRYQLIDNVIVINTLDEQPAPEVPAAPVRADTFDVRGRVINAQGEPLVNATIMAIRAKTITQTNAKGEFSIKGASADDELVVSYIGYKTQRQKIEGKPSLHFVMIVTDNELDKVVVQAYGTTSRRYSTANIGVVSGDEIRKQPIMNPLLALQGKVPGVVITPTTGFASGPVKVEIRGRNSVNPFFTSDPLYIIDGVPLTILELGKAYTPYGSSNAISRGFDQTNMLPSGGQSPFFNINPADIESIEILKDADATAIYGSRGANGVILISTKKGKSGKNAFNLNISQGVNFVTRRWQMLNTTQYLAMRREAFKNDGITPSAASGAGYAPDLLIWDTTRYTDWQDYLYGGTGKWTNAQGSLSGGTQQVNYRLGAGYNRSTDIGTVSGGNQKGSLSFSLTNRSLNNRFVLDFSASYSFTDVDMVNLASTALLPPDAPPIWDSKGNLNFTGWTGLSLPFGNLLTPYSSKNGLLNSRINFTYTFVKGLVGRVSAGYGNANGRVSRKVPIASQNPNTSPPPTGSLNYGNSQANNWITEPQLEYNGLLGQGVLNVLVGGTLQSNNTQALQVQGAGFTDDALLNSMNYAKTITSTENKGQYKYTGVFARVGYRLANRYILNLNARRDGSSRFGPDNRFGNFGSVGAAWIASEEPWIKKFLPQAFSLLKFRGSYGITGSDGVGDYQYVDQWGNLNPILGTYNGISPLTAQLMANPDFHWQANKKMEVALEMSFLNDRINTSVVRYINRCNNQLINFPLATFTGFSTVVANSPADVQNAGWEFSVNARLISRKDFSWTVDVNLGFNKNKLLAYPNLDQSPYYTRYKIGASLDYSYYYKFLGVDPLTGQYSYYDYNHDGKVTANESVPKGTGTDDRYIAISSTPKYSGGFSTQLVYKGIMLSGSFSYSKQRSPNATSSNNGNMNNTSLYQYEHRWRQPGDIAEAPRLTTTPVFSDQSYSTGSGLWSDGSYIRLRSVAFGYMLPQKWAKKAGMSSFSITANASNIFVITRYKGMDPEVYSFGSQPPARTVTAGISCTF